MFTSYEQNLLNNRLPMAATKKFLELQKSGFKPDFSKHADTILANRLRERKVKEENFKERVKTGLSKEADDYVPTKKEHMICDPMDLSPIIPLEIRKKLSREVRAASGTAEKPAIPELCRSVSESCSIEEQKE